MRVLLQHQGVLEKNSQTLPPQCMANRAFLSHVLARIRQISMQLFLLMLQQKALKKLFRPALRFGLRDKGTWTYVIEQVRIVI